MGKQKRRMTESRMADDRGQMADDGMPEAETSG